MTLAYVEVEVDLGQFSDQDLLDEVAERGLKTDIGTTYGMGSDLIDQIYNARRLGKPYDDLLNKLLYEVTGRAI